MSTKVKQYDLESKAYTTTGTASAYELTIPKLDSLYDEFTFMVEFHLENDASATLNINSLGAIAIKTSEGNDIEAGDLKTTGRYALVYDQDSGTIVVSQMVDSEVEDINIVGGLVNGLDGIGSGTPVAYRANYRGETTGTWVGINAIGCWYDNITKQMLLSNNNTVTVYNTNGVLLNTVVVNGNGGIIHGNNNKRFIITKNGCQKINLDSLSVDDTLLGLGYKTLDISPDGSIGICGTYTNPGGQQNTGVATIIAFNTLDMSIINTINISGYEWFMGATLIDNNNMAVILRTASGSTRGYTAYKYNITTGTQLLNVLLSASVSSDDYDMNCKYSPLDNKIYFIQPLFNATTQIRTMDIDFTNINTIDSDPYANWFFYRTSCDSLGRVNLYIQKYSKNWNSLGIPQIAETY